MSTRTEALTVSRITALLPDRPELRPLMERIVAESAPDPTRSWSASGRLGTLGDRLLSNDVLVDAPRELAEEVRRRLEGLYGHLARAVRALADERPADAARAFLDAAGVEEEAGMHEEAEAYVRAARTVVPDRCVDGIEARCLRRLARLARTRGRLADSAELYEEAFELARICEARRESAVAAIGRGNVAVDHGRWDEGEEWYRRAGELLEVLEVGPEHWHVELNLGIVARHRGDLEASEAHLEKGGSMAALVDEEEALPLFSNAWGLLHMAADEPEAAAERYRAGLERIEDPRARARLSVNLGECLLALDRVDEAAELARESEWTALRKGVVRLLPEVYRLMGKVAARKGGEESTVFFERALKVVEERGLPDHELARTLEAYGEVRGAAGDVDAARPKLERAAELYEENGDDRAASRVRSRLGELGGAAP